MVHLTNNLHVYDRHMKYIDEILSNEEYPAPKLWINPAVTDFYSFGENDFALIDYKATKLEEKFEVAQ